MELFPGCYRKVLNDGTGPQVIGQEEPGSKSISLGLWFRSGSRDEKLTESGVTHLIEHLLFRGTENRSAYQITSDVDRLGGHINGSTSREFLLLSLRLLPESLSEGIDILTDLAFNPLFQEDDFRLEKDVVLEEIRSARDNYQSETIRLLQEAIWGEESGLSAPIRGTEETVTELSRSSALDRFNPLKSLDKIMITAAGKLSFDNLVNCVEDSFPEMSSETRSNQNRATGDQCSTPSKTTEGKTDWRDLNQLNCSIGVEGLPKKDDDRFPLEMLNVILGQGMSSRLFRKVRKERGLAYQVTSSTEYYSDTGLFFVYGSIGPGNLDRFVELVLEEFDDLTNEPVTDEELELAKKKTKGNLVLGLENNRALMGRLGITALYDTGFLSVEDVIRKLEEVTPEDITRVANRLLTRKNLRYSLLGPKVDGATNLFP